MIQTCSERLWRENCWGETQGIERGSRFASRSPTEILTIVRADFPSFVSLLVAPPQRDSLSRNPTSTKGVSNATVHRSEESKIVFRRSLRNTTPPSQRAARFACLHNAPDYQFSRERRKLSDSVSQQGFIKRRITW